MRKKIQKIALAGGGLAGVYLLLVAFLAVAATTGAILPSGDGFYTQWSPSAGSSHYLLVDESTCNGNTDYVSTTTIGSRDSYQVSLSAVPDGALITRIDITPCASKKNKGGSASTMNVFYRFNGANSADAGNYSLTGATPGDLSATSFSGLSLTRNASSTLQVGAVLSGGKKGVKLSRVAATITYESTPNAPSNLAVTGISTFGTSTFAALVWTDNSSNETGFQLERSTDNINFSWNGGPAANATSTTSFITSSGTYYFRIRAYNTFGYSSYSNTASTTIP